MVVAKQRNRAYETPENIQAIATDQIKAFRENPCRGIARSHRDKHDLYIALVLTVRDRLSANRREHPELRRLNRMRPSISSISAPPNPTL